MSLATGAVAGAIGGGVAVTVLGPLTAANNFIGSFFFGDGMIIGERKAYQHDWPQIKKRLDNGESFITILEEYTIDNTTAVMASAKAIIEVVKPIWFEMVKAYLISIPQDVLQILTSTLPSVTGPVQNAANQTIGSLTGGLIPQAFADEGQPIQQKFVSDYTAEARRLPFKLLSSIVEKILSGQLNKMPLEKRIAYTQVYKEILANKPKPKTITEAISGSGSVGLLQQIATMYNDLQQILNQMTLGKLKNISSLKGRQLRKRQLQKLFLKQAKKYNAFVAQNRKPKLQINTAKSLQTLRLVPK